MAVTLLLTCLCVTNILLSTSYSASVYRISKRDPDQDLDRAARADSYSFYKDFGKTQVGSWYNKNNESGGFNASHQFDNGNFGGKFNWDNNGRFNGSGRYSSNDGRTNFGGNLNYGKDGKPKGAFLFSHNF